MHVRLEGLEVFISKAAPVWASSGVPAQHWELHRRAWIHGCIHNACFPWCMLPRVSDNHAHSPQIIMLPSPQIIMLTRLKEGAATKCEDYTGGFLGPTPPEGPTTVGDVEVCFFMFMHCAAGPCCV